MDSFGGIVNRFNDAAAQAGDILRRNFMNSPTAGTMPPSAATSTNILSGGPVKLPPKPVPAAQVSTKQLLQGMSGPGVTPVKTVLNKPAAAGAKGLKMPKGLGSALAKGEAATAILAAAEMGLSASGTPYGDKVKGARAGMESTRQGATDYVLDGLSGIPGGVGDFFGGFSNTQRPGGMPNLGADYKGQEQQAINDALLFQGQQNKQRQLEAGGTMGMLDDDYKATEGAAFEAAAEAGDNQPAFVSAAATGTDTSTSRRDAPPKELSAGMAAWAKANPLLADELIKKVQGRRLTDPKYKQSGYSTILETMRPGAADDAFGLQSSGYDAVKQDDGTFAAPKYVEVGGKPALFKEEGEITPMTNDEIIAERKLGKKSSGRASAKGLAQVRKAGNETAAALPPNVSQNPDFDAEITSQYNAAGLKGGGVTGDIAADMRKKSIRAI